MIKPIKLPVVYYSEYAEQQEKTNEMLGLDTKLSVEDYEIKYGYFWQVSGITVHNGFKEPMSTLYSGGSSNTIAMPIDELLDAILTWQNPDKIDYGTIGK